MRIPSDSLIPVKDIVNVGENVDILTINSLKYIIRVFNRELGVKIKFHYLRHKHATLLLERDINPKVFQELLRHSKFTISLVTDSNVTSNM